jgi:D-arabinose 1-dehydrogenase-like Zn-dependent alcohol dehydrogenase
MNREDKMKNKAIVFTKANTAEFLELDEFETLGEYDVKIKTEFSTVSCGTEKANITGDPNVNGAGPSTVVFPRTCGYSSAGTVIEIGKEVKNFKTY